jgi:hypothetical protein
MGTKVLPATNAPATYRSLIHVKIGDYANNSSYRPVMWEAFILHTEADGGLITYRGGGIYKEASTAISSFIFAPAGGNFVTGSKYAVYGLN